MKRITLRKSDIRDLNQKIQELYGPAHYFDKKDKIELIDDSRIYHKGLLCFFYQENILVPTLKLILEADFPIRTVTVDMGAVKHVVGGADIMRPGITEFAEDLKKDDFVAIVDVNNKKPLAIGQMLFSKEEAEALTSGKVVKSIHHVGDELWKG